MGLISAIIGWLQYHLGLRTDAADSTGSIHAKLTELISVLLVTKYRTNASSNLQASSNAEVDSSNTIFVKVKEIQMVIGGSIRVAFDLKSYSGSTTCSGQIYVNYIAVGTLRTTTSTSYSTYTEDITVKPGDFVQVFIKTTANFGYVENLRIYYDKVVIDSSADYIVIS